PKNRTQHPAKTTPPPGPLTPATPTFAGTTAMAPGVGVASAGRIRAVPQVGQKAESAVNAEPHFVQNTLNPLRSYSPLSHTKFPAGNDPPAGASLLAALAQKFVQATLRFRVALARRGSQQNSCLVAI